VSIPYSTTKCLVLIWTVRRKRIEIFVLQMSKTCADSNAFKQVVRDFLIQLKEFESDNADLFEEEKELAQAAKQEQDMRVPGLVKPSQIQDEDES
jgi:exportin-1